MLPSMISLEEIMEGIMINKPIKRVREPLRFRTLFVVISCFPYKRENVPPRVDNQLKFKPIEPLSIHGYY